MFLIIYEGLRPPCPHCQIKYLKTLEMKNYIFLVTTKMLGNIQLTMAK
jgi:hypothetical protein